MADTCRKICACDPLGGSPVEGVRQHGNAAGKKYPVDRILRVRVAVLVRDLVQEVLEGILLVLRMSFFYEKCGQVGLSGVLKGKQRIELFFRKSDIEILLKKQKSFVKKGDPNIVTGLNDLSDRFVLRVKAVSQDVVFSDLIFTGKLDTGKEFRVAFFKSREDLLIAFDRIVIGKRKIKKPGLPNFPQKVKRGIRSVGHRRMHVKIDPA